MIMDLPLALYRWAKSTSDSEFRIESSTQRENMTVGNYLSRDMGVGGQIVGFLEYNQSYENTEERKKEVVFLNFPTLTRSREAFAQRPRDLIAIIPSHLKELVNSGKIVEVKDPELNSCINPKPDIIQHAKLGMLMDKPNAAEHNFVGDHTFKVRVLKNGSILPYPTIKEFMDDIYKEAVALGTTSKIKETIPPDTDCDTSNKSQQPIIVNPYDNGSQSEPEVDESSLFIQQPPKRKAEYPLPPAKRAKIGSKRKTLRRKRHRRLRTRKVAGK